MKKKKDYWKKKDYEQEISDRFYYEPFKEKPKKKKKFPKKPRDEEE